jgi:Cu(I)/Ag(I) efflux system membrane fusion protein
VVYLDRGGGLYEQRAIRLGRLGDSDYEVLEGLAPDDRVVVQGNLLIDAQAQLNQTLRAAEEADHSHALPTSQPTAPTAAHAELSAKESSSLRKFLTDADAMRSALADDDLPAFHRATDSIAPELESLRHTLSAQPTGIPWAEQLPRSAPIGPHPDLRTARKAYHAFSLPLVALAKQLRSHANGFKDLKIFRCPMTAEAFDGAPARAEWLQWSSPLRNPWFGAEMLECGVEVRE